MDISYFLSKRTQIDPSEPLFFNRAAGRYETSAILSKCENELLDKNMPKSTRRSSRSLYKKKMINLLPEIPDNKKKKEKDKSLVRVDPLSLKKYHATIDVDSEIYNKSKMNQEKEEEE